METLILLELTGPMASPEDDDIIMSRRRIAWFKHLNNLSGGLGLNTEADTQTGYPQQGFRDALTDEMVMKLGLK